MNPEVSPSSAYCFGFLAHNFTVFVHCHHPHQSCLQQQQADVFQRKGSDKPTICYLPTTK